MILLVLKLMLISSALAADYKSCILFHFHARSNPALLLACDGEKLGEAAYEGRSPAAEKPPLALQFDELVKAFKLNHCSDVRQDSEGFISCWRDREAQTEGNNP